MTAIRIASCTLSEAINASRMLRTESSLREKEAMHAGRPHDRGLLVGPVLIYIYIYIGWINGLQQGPSWRHTEKNF